MGLKIFWGIFPIFVFFAIRFLFSLFPRLEKGPFKTIDFIVPFLALGLHELSQLTFKQSIFPFWLIIMMLLGIGLALFFGYYYGELSFKRFFKVFWRLIFLLSALLYLIFFILSFTA